MADLRTWWNALDPFWKRILKIQINQSFEVDKAGRDAYAPTDNDLSELTQRQNLDIRGASISTLQPLTAFTNLKSLGLYHLQKINNIDPLSELSTLETLSVENILATSFEPLGVLANLKLLILRTCGARNLNFVKTLQNLEQAAFIEPYLSDISGINGSPKLECLKLSRIEAKDMSILASLPKIKKLVLKGLGTTSLTFLSSLGGLKELYVKNLPVEDITAIQSLSQLETLDLTSCSVKDVSCLTVLKRLTSLNLIKTQVKDLSPLHITSSLRTLHISEQNFKGDAIKTLIKAMPQCELLTKQGRFPFHTYYHYRVIKSFKNGESSFEQGQLLRYTDSTHNSYDDIEICYFKTETGLSLRWDIYSQALDSWKEYMEVVKE